MNQTGLSENEKVGENIFGRSILHRFERSKILEVYFLRLDGRVPAEISSEEADLYKNDLNSLKGFLLGQHPQDTLLQKIFRIMN